jgi:hypothetical protein
MRKPSALSVATAVFTAGICNALIYSLGYIVLVALQFLTKGGGGANFGSAATAFIMTLAFSLLISSIVTFLLAFPIAVICRAFGFTGQWAFVFGPTIGAALVCFIASRFDVAMSTYVAIVAFSFITSAIMWLMLGRPEAVPESAVPSQANRADGVVA